MAGGGGGVTMDRDIQDDYEWIWPLAGIALYGLLALLMVML